MGQGEVLKALEEKGQLTEQQIAEMLNVTVNSVCVALNKLIKHKEVEREFNEFQSDGKRRCGCYIFKIRMEV
jgi:DNA-binding MarR family transcriptional regulator